MAKTIDSLQTTVLTVAGDANKQKIGEFILNSPLFLPVGKNKGELKGVFPYVSRTIGVK
jgi:hypothetical protein